MGYAQEDGSLVADSKHTGRGWEAGGGLDLRLNDSWSLTPGVRYRRFEPTVRFGGTETATTLAYLMFDYQARGDTAMVRKLQAAPVSLTEGTSDAWMRVRDAAMHGLGVGTTRDMTSVITGVFLPVWQCRAYTLGEKIAVWRGKAWSRNILWEEVLRTDLAELVDRVDIPVYFFLGRHDYTTSYDLAHDYLLRLHAPVKGFYTFENSAHSPLFEEPQRAREILRKDVLAQGTSLADAMP